MTYDEQCFQKFFVFVFSGDSRNFLCCDHLAETTCTLNWIFNVSLILSSYFAMCTQQSNGSGLLDQNVCTCQTLDHNHSTLWPFVSPLVTLSFHSEPAMRLRNPSMDASGGSQLFEDTSGAAAGSHTGYRCPPLCSLVPVVWGSNRIILFVLSFLSASALTWMTETLCSCHLAKAYFSPYCTAPSKCFVLLLKVKLKLFVRWTLK